MRGCPKLIGLCEAGSRWAGNRYLIERQAIPVTIAKIVIAKADGSGTVAAGDVASCMLRSQLRATLFRCCPYTLNIDLTPTQRVQAAGSLLRRSNVDILLAFHADETLILSPTYYLHRAPSGRPNCEVIAYVFFCIAGVPRTPYP